MTEETFQIPKEPFFSSVMNILMNKLLPSGGVPWMLNCNPTGPGYNSSFVRTINSIAFFSLMDPFHTSKFVKLQ